MNGLSNNVLACLIAGCLLLVTSQGSAVAQTIEKQSDGSILVTCPSEVHIAPVKLPSGWNTFGSPAISFSMLAVSGKVNTVGCWYGKTEVTLVIIGTTVEVGYECKALDLTSDPRTAICTLPPKSTNRRRDVRERAKPR